MDTLIVRYAEIGTKGKNRAMFEKRLVKNLRKALEDQNVEFQSISRVRGRIYVNSIQSNDLLNKLKLKFLFGMSSYSLAYECSHDIDEIKNSIDMLIKSFESTDRFRITTKRLIKNFPYTSTELNCLVGEYVVKKTNAHVSLKRFTKEIRIEIINKKAYVYDKIYPGPCGLPVGVQGRVLSLIRNNNSILSSILIMKRGCSVIPIQMVDSKFKLPLGILSDVKKINSIDELEGPGQELDIIGVVYDFTFNQLDKLTTHNLLGIYPLIGYNKKELEELEGRYLK